MQSLLVQEIQVFFCKLTKIIRSLSSELRHSYQMQKSEQGLLGLINNFRDEMGFSPLTWDEELYDIAAQINSSVDKESNDLMTKTPRFPGRSLHILRE